MNSAFWDQLAETYEEEVFDVRTEDVQGTVASWLSRFSGKHLRAADLGCGIGSWLPDLADRFGNVFAVDQSIRCLEIARRDHETLENVQFMCADLSEGWPLPARVHLALSVNVLIDPELHTRQGMLSSLVEGLLRGGRVVIVVPSFEAQLYANFRHIEWNLRDGMAFRRAVRTGFDKEVLDPGRLGEGILLRDGVPTKHYVREELVAVLPAFGLTIEHVDRVEYSWESEFDSPPAWMGGPLPWDWLLVARKAH